MNKNKLVRLAILFLVAWHGSAFAAEWGTDLPNALARAKAENKVVLLDFTGSDWCGWCIKLKEEVFDQPAFVAYAQQKLILVEVDFPREKRQTPGLHATNEELAKRFNVSGFPTIIVLDANGNKLLRDGYEEGGAPNYIALLERVIKKTEATQATSEKPAPPPAPKPWQPIPQAPPVVFSKLDLKGIVGSKSRRFALINNQTLAAGEKAMIRMESGPIEIMCKEIRDDSVLVMVKGESEPKVLRLKK